MNTLDQPDLFTGTMVLWREQPAPRVLVIRTPASRAGDPETSHVAEAHVNATGKRASDQDRVAALVSIAPGRTARELAAGGSLSHETLHKRLPECVTGGAVRRGEPRRCAQTGRMATTWWPA